MIATGALTLLLLNAQWPLRAPSLIVWITAACTATSIALLILSLMLPPISPSRAFALAPKVVPSPTNRNNVILSI